MKRLILIMVFALVAFAFADNWQTVGESKIQTTVGYTQKGGAEYICEWIRHNDYTDLSINVRSIKPFYIGKYRTACLLLGDYVFMATLCDGYGENSVLVRVRGRKLKELLEEQNEAVIMVSGYPVYTVINAEIGEFKL